MKTLKVKVCMKDVVQYCVNGVKYDVIEWMKRNTLRWFGHMERKSKVHETDGTVLVREEGQL